MPFSNTIQIDKTISKKNYVNWNKLMIHRYDYNRARHHMIIREIKHHIYKMLK